MINVSFHHGTLDECYSAISEFNEDLIVSAIKKSEDSDGAVIRVYEAEGKSVSSNATLFGKEYRLGVSPYAIETVDEYGRVLNFVEWEI